MTEIEARMATGQPFTYGSLCRTAGQPQDPDRAVDKAIQKWRRKGWIALTREGRQVVWSLTDAGRVAVAEMTP
jgi:DNA-binding transcriptional regulator PaaX